MRGGAPLMRNEMQHQEETLTELKTENARIQARLERLEQTRNSHATAWSK